MASRWRWKTVIQTTMPFCGDLPTVRRESGEPNGSEKGRLNAIWSTDRLGLTEDPLSTDRFGLTDETLSTYRFDLTEDPLSTDRFGLTKDPLSTDLRVLTHREAGFWS